jgi:hypothetical protein
MNRSQIARVNRSQIARVNRSQIARVNRSRTTRGESPRPLDLPRLVALLSQESRQASSPSFRCLRRRGRVEFWRATLSNVSFTSFTRPPAPFSPTRNLRKLTSRGRHPVSRLRVWNPAVAVPPTPPRLLATRTANRSSPAFGHDPVPAASRSRPDWVPEPAVREGCKNVRNRL